MSKATNRAIDLAWQLNDLVVDLKTPVDLAALLEIKGALPGEKMSLSRMIIGSLVVNLCKLLEILNYYGKEIQSLPAEARADLLTIKQSLESRDIYAYRSTYIAHAFLRDGTSGKRPLVLKEAIAALIKIVDQGAGSPHANLQAFCRWVYSVEDQHCVVNAIHSTVRWLEQSNTGGLGRRPMDRAAS